MADDFFRQLLEETATKRLSQWKGYALSLTRNPADAEEVVQEALERTLRARPDLDSEGRVNRYVVRAIRNRAFSLIRKRKPLGDVQELEHRLPPASSALELMLDEENEEARRRLGQALRAHLGDLRPHHREAIEMLVMRNPPLKFREAAEAQGVSITTVRYRLERGLKLLLEAVKAAGEVDLPGESDR